VSAAVLVGLLAEDADSRAVMSQQPGVVAALTDTLAAQLRTCGDGVALTHTLFALKALAAFPSVQVRASPGFRCDRPTSRQGNVAEKGHVPLRRGTTVSCCCKPRLHACNTCTLTDAELA
jgi:hypothetical protein